jgi:hypothetical protein
LITELNLVGEEDLNEVGVRRKENGRKVGERLR